MARLSGGAGGVGGGELARSLVRSIDFRLRSVGVRSSSPKF